MSFQEPVPSAHIPRPPNAFICFRSRFVRDQKEQGSTSSGMKEFSRQAGHVWNEMSEAQRRPYIELADRIKAEHKVTYPDYKFTPAKKGTGRGASVRAPRPSRRTEGQRGPEYQSSMGLDAYYRQASSNSMPTPHAPQPRYGQLYLPPDLSGAAGRNEKSHSTNSYPYPRSDRPEAWNHSPSQFGTRDAAFPAQGFMSGPGPSRTNHTPAYDRFLETDPYFNSELEQDFGALCDWDYDFSRSSGSAPSSTRSSHYRPY